MDRSLPAEMNRPLHGDGALSQYGKRLVTVRMHVDSLEPLSIVQRFGVASQQITKRYGAAFNSAWLQRILDRTDFTQAEIAEMLAVSKSTVTNFKEGIESTVLRDKFDFFFGSVLDRDPPLRRLPRAEIRREALVALSNDTSEQLSIKPPTSLDRVGYEYLRSLRRDKAWLQALLDKDTASKERAVKRASKETADFFETLQSYPGVKVPKLKTTLEEVEATFLLFGAICEVLEDEIGCFLSEARR